jgi:protease I
MTQNLNGKKIAILVDKGFEEVELTSPKQALEDAGAQTFIVSPQDGTVQAWNRTDWGQGYPVDVPLEQANPRDYDALVLPGGVMNPDKLRMNPTAIQFIKDFFTSGKPVAAICHGPWTLIEAGVVKGRTLTSYPSLQTDLKNAGAHWVDQPVVVDRGLVTSRRPHDLEAFDRKMVEEFAEGPHNPTTSQPYSQPTTP